MSVDTKTWAWLFPGQGSQWVGMGKDFFESSKAARAIFERADAALGDSLSKTMFEGPEADLTLTSNAQPALVTMSMAVLAAVRERYPEIPLPRCAAGHSLGEYSALVAAGVLTFEDAVKVVRARGQAMQSAVAPGEGAMSAILNVSEERLVAICEETARASDENGSAYGVVSCANFNTLGQIVIAGTARAVARAAVLASAEKGKAIPLHVSAPFHCSLMAPAAKALAHELEKVHVAPFLFSVITNVCAQENSDSTRVKGLLVEQVTAPVLWDPSVRLFPTLGVTHALEMGPGKVLSGLGRRSVSGIHFLSVGDLTSLDAAAEFFASASSANATPRESPANVTA